MLGADLQAAYGAVVELQRELEVFERLTSQPYVLRGPSAKPSRSLGLKGHGTVEGGSTADLEDQAAPKANSQGLLLDVHKVTQVGGEEVRGPSLEHIASMGARPSPALCGNQAR